jgi:hypothetical protein
VLSEKFNPKRDKNPLTRISHAPVRNARQAVSQGSLRRVTFSQIYKICLCLAPTLPKFEGDMQLDSRALSKEPMQARVLRALSRRDSRTGMKPGLSPLAPSSQVS